MACIITGTETQIQDSYLGWSNWETWNVALWLQNDEGLYDLARQYRHRGYENLAVTLNACGIYETPDGASFTDSELSIDELDAMLEDI